MTCSAKGAARHYQPPALIVLGSVHGLTQATCVEKTWGSSDGHTFMGVAIKCSGSA